MKLVEFYENLKSKGLTPMPLYEGFGEYKGWEEEMGDTKSLALFHEKKVVVDIEGKTLGLYPIGEVEISYNVKNNKIVEILCPKDASEYLASDEYLDDLIKTGKAEIKKMKSWEFKGKTLKGPHLLQAIAEIMGEEVPELKEIEELKSIGEKF